jgi:hypothetical protein
VIVWRERPSAWSWVSKQASVDPWGEDPEELRTWLGEWRPDAFDLAETKVGFDR